MHLPRPQLRFVLAQARVRGLVELSHQLGVPGPHFGRPQLLKVLSLEVGCPKSQRVQLEESDLRIAVALAVGTVAGDLRRYAFYSVAHDGAGNIETKPPAAETSTKVQANVRPKSSRAL
jgi:hypothetical protein